MSKQQKNSDKRITKTTNRTRAVANADNAGEHPKKLLFLEHFRKTGNVAYSARMCDISRGVVYQWLTKDPEFSESMKDAESEATENLEAECYRRAVEGVNKPIFHQGEMCGVIREYSDTLLIFLLKGRAPEKYSKFEGLQGIPGQNGPTTIVNNNLTVNSAGDASEILRILAGSGAFESEVTGINGTETDKVHTAQAHR